MMIPGIRTVIADNEGPARSHLRLLLRSESGVEIVAECGNGPQTLAAVQTHKPDLLMLDVRLPHEDAFHMLSHIPLAERPFLIFTSTNDEHAIRALEARALDYLLKPFELRRLHAAIERTRAEMLEVQDRHLARRLLGLLAGAKSDSQMDRRLVVKSGGKVIFLPMDEIDWVEAAANYVKLQAGEQSYLMREGIGRIANRLDSRQFVRIHRSVIVNVEKIKELHPCNRGEYMVVLKDGKELSCSRGYRARLQQLIAGA